MILDATELLDMLCPQAMEDGVPFHGDGKTEVRDELDRTLRRDDSAARLRDKRFGPRNRQRPLQSLLDLWWERFRDAADNFSDTRKATEIIVGGNRRYRVLLRASTCGARPSIASAGLDHNPVVEVTLGAHWVDKLRRNVQPADHVRADRS